ncbi:chemotaxis protein CheW [uncultured Parasphingorhabdus sp.]|uniref:chemotaxis protein CheW n=1 Tax=uncultured Parasphingorhabdus sp. TaxID=2709694 RepID=UPI0030D6DEBA|tara:strand:+ start:4810 stop:5232 length:423 start_codon:yes stop_codon:yes gene_type:complete
MNMPVLLVQLAGQRIALPALEIDSVIKLDKITPVPGVPPHIIGISSLRSRALTVIDCAKMFGVIDYDSNGTKHAAVLNFEGHDYALLVDMVEDVVDALTDPVPVPGGAGEIWSKISDGLIETQVGPAMLIKVDTVINNLH